MRNLFNKITIISFLIGFICYPIFHLPLTKSDSIVAISSVFYTIITFFILATAISAKNSWEKEQKLKIYQEIFKSLVNIINWLNDFYDFSINENRYQGQRAYENEYINKDYEGKKQFIIQGCEGAFRYFEKVSMAMNKLLISKTTEEEIKKYCKSLNKTFEDLQTSNDAKEDEKRPIEIKINANNLELQKIINLIRQDSGIKEETKCQI